MLKNMVQQLLFVSNVFYVQDIKCCISMISVSHDCNVFVRDYITFVPFSLDDAA